MHPRQRILPWLAMLGSVTLWGVSFVSTKLLLRELPAVSIAWFRLLPALLVLGILMLRQGETLRPARADRWRFVLAAAFGIVFYMVLENNGLRFTAASTASMLVASIPVFVLVIESLLSRSRLPLAELTAIALSLAGVWLVLFDGRWPDFGQSSFLGNALVLGAMAAWIIYTFIARGLGRSYSGLKQTTLQSLCALVLYLPFLAGDLPAWRLPSPLALANLLFLGVFCSGLAYVTWLYALARLGATLPSAFLNLIPVVTTLTALLVLGEVPGWWQAAGTVLILGSLGWLGLHKWRKAPRRAGDLPPGTPQS
jgi:drug/metabolite transporter (DMT)-like permease